MDCFLGLFQCWHIVQRLVGGDLGKTLDGFIVDAGWAVKDTVKMFSPSVKNFFFLRDQGCSVSTEKWGGSG